MPAKRQGDRLLNVIPRSVRSAQWPFTELPAAGTGRASRPPRRREKRSPERGASQGRTTATAGLQTTRRPPLETHPYLSPAATPTTLIPSMRNEDISVWDKSGHF